MESSGIPKILAASISLNNSLFTLNVALFAFIYASTISSDVMGPPFNVAEVNNPLESEHPQHPQSR